MDLKIKNFYNLKKSNLLLTFTLLYFFISFIPYKNVKVSLQNLTFLNYKSFLFLNPWILFFLSFNLFSMGGIPPLSGVFSKFLLFNVLFDNNNFTLLIICLFLFFLLSNFRFVYLRYYCDIT